MRRSKRKEGFTSVKVDTRYEDMTGNPEPGLLSVRTPEARMWAAVMEIGLSDYSAIRKVKETRPLNKREEAFYQHSRAWMFEDDPEYWSLYSITEYISEDPDALRQGIRKIATEKPEKLKFLSGDILGVLRFYVINHDREDPTAL